MKVEEHIPVQLYVYALQKYTICKISALRCVMLFQIASDVERMSTCEVFRGTIGNVDSAYTVP